MIGKFGDPGELYRFASENAHALMSLDLERLAPFAVCSCGSGDQALLLAARGFRRVDVFDVQPKAFEWMRLKMFLICRLDRNGFASLVLSESLAGLARIADGMRSREAGACSDAPQASFSEALAGCSFRGSFDGEELHRFCCPYLGDGALYARLQAALLAGSCEFSFRQCCVKDLWNAAPEGVGAEAEDFGGYGLAYFSNIAEYAGSMFAEADFLGAFARSCGEPALERLAPGGVLALAYCYDCDNEMGSAKRSPIALPQERARAFGALGAGGFEYGELRAASPIDRKIWDCLCLVTKKI